MEALKKTRAVFSWRKGRGSMADSASEQAVVHAADDLDLERTWQPEEAETDGAELPWSEPEELEDPAGPAEEATCTKVERTASSDPERIYFAQMGAIPRLTHAEEIRIAIRMEYARFRMQDLLFATRLGQRKVLELLADSHARRVLMRHAAEAITPQDADEDRVRSNFLAACAHIQALAAKNERDHERLKARAEGSLERAKTARRLARRLQLTAECVRKLGISPAHTLRWTDELVGLVAALRSAHGESPAAEGDSRFVAASYEAYADLIARGTVLARQYDRYCKARNTLSVKNLRLVVSIARRYRHAGVPLLDLIQEGNVGLLRACDGFEYRKGCRFSTYASHWIRQSISCAVAERSGMIRFPRHAAGKFAKIRAHLRDEFGKHGIVPDTESIARETDSSEAHVRRFVTLSRGPLSLDSRLDDESDSMAEVIAHDCPSPAGRASRLETIRERIEYVLGGLPSIDREIMRLRYGIGVEGSWSLRELAGKFDLSPESIRQIEGRTLRRLQREQVAVHLQELLE